MKTRLIILFLSIFIINGMMNLDAQVTIGSGNEPNDYAVLQIDGTNGGIRLPKLDAQGRSDIELEFDANSSGLVIYYIPENAFQFWDGGRWVSMKSLRQLDDSRNAITGRESFMLGSNLIKDTEITQGDKHVYFDVSSGRFSIGDNIFVANNDGIGIGKSPANTLFDVQAPAINNLRIRTEGETLAPDYVLASDGAGNAKWENLEPDPFSIIRPLLEVNIASSSTYENPVAISNTLNLTHGVWLIVARYVAQSSNSSTNYSQYGYHSWIRLRKDGSNSNIAAIGTLPQYDGVKTSTGTGTLLSTPQLAYILEVPLVRQNPADETSPEIGENYTLYGDLRHAGGITFRITNKSTTYGDSYLYAIRLSF